MLRPHLISTGSRMPGRRRYGFSSTWIARREDLHLAPHGFAIRAGLFVCTSLLNWTEWLDPTGTIMALRKLNPIYDALDSQNYKQALPYSPQCRPYLHVAFANRFML